MSPRAKTVLFGTTTVGISVLLCFLFVEFVATYFIYADAQESIDKQFDSTLGWRYAPGTYRVKPDSSFSTHTIRINQLGLRGNDGKWSAEKTRIVVLGDSFTFARYVPEQDMFTSRLETILNGRSSGRHEVINAGVEGYGTAQQLLLLRELSKSGLVGDLYVVQVFTNDILDNLRLDYESLSTNALRPGYVLDENKRLRLEHAPDRQQWLGGGEPKGVRLRTFRVFAAAAESYAQSRPALVELAMSLGFSVSLPRKPGLISGWYDDDVLRRGIPLMTQLLEEIKLEVERRNAALLVLFIPSPLMVYPDSYRSILTGAFPADPQVSAFFADVERPDRAVQKICEELGIPLLDTYPILLHNKTRALYFPSDGHLEKEGHAIVADALAERITGMLRDRARP